ncbi:MAG: hypothetical protein FWH41_09860 [Treponema sp.]|nr:hypothetical protein [Treponema sp.]
MSIIKQKKPGKAAFALAVAVVIFTSCVSTVTFNVQRPPNLNTTGITRIAIMPFEDSLHTSFSSLEQRRIQAQMLTFLSESAIEKIQAMNYFTLVSSFTIQQIQKNNEKIDDYADALFCGKITNISVNDSVIENEIKDSETGEKKITLSYTREAVIEYNYYLTRSYDGLLIGPVSKTASEKDSNANQNSLKPGIELLKTAVNAQLSKELNRDLAPYYAAETRSIMNEKTKDKELKEKMKNALAQIKGKNYRIALDNYLSIYNEYGNSAAAINASIVYEVLGDFHSAIALLSNEYNRSGNSKAREELVRVNKILQDQARIASDFSGSNQLEKTAAYASGEIRKVLPENAKVWILNGSGAETEMAGAAVDNIRANLILMGISVVDRDNLSLIESEINFQLQGNVSDSELISLGSAVGANTIVSIAVTGTGAMRRLQVRVVDIEKGISLLQSDTSDNWKL